MNRVLAAGAAYFAAVFAAGIALGALRVLVVAPAIGEPAATLAELPVMLAIAWLACGAALRGFAVPAGYEARAVTGLFAFALLMVAESVLGAALGVSLEARLARVDTLEGAFGLAAQFVFGALPLFRS